MQGHSSQRGKQWIEAGILRMRPSTLATPLQSTLTPVTMATQSKYLNQHTAVLASNPHWSQDRDITAVKSNSSSLDIPISWHIIIMNEGKPIWLLLEVASLIPWWWLSVGGSLVVAPGFPDEGLPGPLGPPNDGSSCPHRLLGDGPPRAFWWFWSLWSPHDFQNH